MGKRDVPLADLFQLDRFASGPEMFFLIFYAPIGLVLAIFRLFLAIQLLLVLLVLKKTWLFTRLLLRVCGTVLGIVVTTEGKENLHRENIKIIISNNVTIIDNVAMEIATPCIMQESRSGCMKFVERRLNGGMAGEKIYMQHDELEEKIPEMLAADPTISFLAFPEDSNTSEKSAGLIKFGPWPFGISDTVVPALITTNRLPFPPIYYSVLRSHWISEMFWFFFVPYTHFHIRFLPSITKQEERTKDQFCHHVEKIMASTLGIRTTPYSSINKAVYEIKLRREEELRAAQEQNGEAQASTPTRRTGQTIKSESPGHDTRLNKMAIQVKEVLPQVPLEAIKNDLGKTRCVDTTITNIIEGKVTYTPEDATSKPSTSSQPTTSSTSPPKASTAAASFSPSSEKRQQSFEERKRNMIEEARRRYIAKHGL